MKFTGRKDAGVRWSRVARRLLGVLVGLTVLIVPGGAQAVMAGAAAAGAWKIQQTPDAPKADISGLSAVSCPSRRICTAVGSSSVSVSSTTRPLAERWSGKRWRVQPMPAPKGTSDTLYGLSCPSARACVAVGDAFRSRDTPLVEAWNGRSWRVQATPAIKSRASLYAVSCTSASSCMAVGFTLVNSPKAIIERWNGQRWRMQTIPRPATSTRFLEVSCSAMRACTAVGYQSSATGSTRPLAESWNGKTWKVQGVRLPQAGMFDAVSCTSPSACTATGTELDTGGTALAERWNGKTWRMQTTPNPPNYTSSFGDVRLNGISCTSTKACTASGDYSPGGAAAYFVDSWNGKGWQLKPTPRPAGFQRGALLAVSCSFLRCTAVGAYTGQVHLQVTLAMAR